MLTKYLQEILLEDIYLKNLRIVQTEHNNKIKKEAVCYTPACEWPTATLSQAYVPQPTPIINSVICAR